ncbi:hypothetical protein SISNIDRAFT_548358 [Sistotremastrum niveocremeum HHB9708]|uniref:CsbD-like domain-containing protein n=2 Tax=Sistotremastraceae TaxID=3402574 RepID=A0A164WXE4_9AGAM|nr:hypothetical protein SISNIDRAFT_548358 [Sistotremastrum niveocremeum HHB9708]KZT39768.1 hypothetical protein SISSUDRAFT_1019658 [Sistotremastrum suecicum HHB10207 ss-3]
MTTSVPYDPTAPDSLAAPHHHVHGSSDPLPTRSSLNDSQNGEFQTSDERSSGQNGFNSDRPLDVQPAPEGGVAQGGQEGLPEGKANAVDKIVGKVEKVIGKHTHNPELHEKGELRESGGKGAQEGTARAPHD